MIVNKYNKGGGGDMSQYWTSAQTEAAITAATEDLASEEYVDSAISAVTSDAPSKVWVTGATESMIEDAIQTETARTENTYAKPADIPSLEGYATEAYVTAATSDMATKTWVGQQGYLTQHQSLAGLFADVEYVSSAKTINFYDQGNNLVGQVDATDFIKDGMVDTVQISGSSLVITFNTDAGKQDIVIALTDIFNPENYYTKAEVDAEITGATQGLATENYVDSAISAVTSDAPSKAWVTGDTETRIATAMAAETARTESTYAKPSQIPSLVGYATENYVDAAITAATEDLATEDYVDAAVSGVTVDLSDYYTSGQTNSAISAATSPIQTQLDDIERVTATALTELHDGILELSGATGNYATKAYVDSAISSAATGFTSTSDFEDFAGMMQDKEEVVASALTELHDSVAEISGNTPDMSDYWTSAQTRNAITAATQNMATQAYVTAATANLASQSYVTSAVTAATASETGRTESTYAKKTEIAHMVTSSDDSIQNIIKISQSDYDDLVNDGDDDPYTFYVITGQTSN